MACAATWDGPLRLEGKIPASRMRRPDPTPGPEPPQVTDLLMAWRAGDRHALDALVPLVHAELLRLARRQMSRERDHHTLQTTALVSEAYLRLIDLSRVRWQDRGHFFAMATRLMRRILVDHARARRQQKRGSGVTPEPLDQAMAVARERPADQVALDDALEALAGRDPRKAQVVELRYYGGLTVAETADVLKVSVETVHRDWRIARLLLFRLMRGDAVA